MNDALEREYERQTQRWMQWDGPMPVLKHLRCPTYPDDLMGLACGARTRAGGACKMTSIYRNGRCKLHGGLSTGPRTADGQKRSAMNGLIPKRTP